MWEVGWLEVCLGLVGVLVTLLYRFSTSTYSYWAKRDVPFVPPYPFFGSSLKTAFGREALVDAQHRHYRFFGESPFGGVYTFRRPTLFIKDPALVEQVMIKDFSTFYNRGFKPDLELDPLSAHLVNLEDNEWKALRNKLTPAFSSGKLRSMQGQLLHTAELLVRHIRPYAIEGKSLDVKSVMANYAVDLIGSVAFGLTLNSLDNPDSEFRKIGGQLFKGSLGTRLRFALRSQFPRLLKFLRWKTMPKEMEDFFMKMVRDTVEYREKNDIRRDDFFQIMMDLRQRDLQQPKVSGELVFNDTLMTANAFVFLLAGYDTTSLTITWLLYELAAHPDFQEAVHAEIEEKLAKHGGHTYEAVREMALLDQALSESLRLHPPAGAVVRKARNNYQVPGSDLILPAGSFVFIPIYSLQHDPKYWPEPERFLPERFAEPTTITKGTYLPFGDGPRICIGLRLAKLEVKTAVVELLRHYCFTVSERTQRPFHYSPRTIFLEAIGGIWLDITLRTPTGATSSATHVQP